MSDYWKDIATALDARFGPKQWHCDDLEQTAPACVQAFLRVARAPGHGGTAPALYATHGGRRVRVVMASRFGDVGITTDLTAEHGYDQRVMLPELTAFSATP